LHTVKKSMQKNPFSAVSYAEYTVPDGTER